MQEGILETIKEWVWGPWLLFLMLAVGLYYTIHFDIFQIRRWDLWWKGTAGSIGNTENKEHVGDVGEIRDIREIKDIKEMKDTEDTSRAKNGSNGIHKVYRGHGTHEIQKTHEVQRIDEIQKTHEIQRIDEMQKTQRIQGVSQFQATCTALAATVGTGNIAGVATALVAGGAGAIFWMWVSSLVGMMTAYAENFLGVLYRERDKSGQYHGGPMLYIEKGMKRKNLAVVYAICTVLASFGMGSMVQANSLADTLQYTFQFPVFWTAVILTTVVGLVLWGGMGRITKVTEKLLPFSAGIYIVLALVVVLANIKEVPAVFSLICKDAFRFDSMAGGALGYGISRGVFSNEAGLGSLSILHSQTENTTPHEQGMWGIFDVFFDTILMCTLTAMAILVRPEIRAVFMVGTENITIENIGIENMGIKNIGTELLGAETIRDVILGEVIGQSLDGASLASWAISQTVGTGGSVFIAMAMICFAFATIVGWYCLGSQAAVYLTGGKLFLYRLLYLEAIFFGCVMQLKVVWNLSDIFNGLMAIPNLLALIYLRKYVKIPENADRIWFFRKKEVDSY